MRSPHIPTTWTVESPSLFPSLLCNSVNSEKHTPKNHAQGTTKRFSLEPCYIPPWSQHFISEHIPNKLICLAFTELVVVDITRGKKIIYYSDRELNTGRQNLSFSKTGPKRVKLFANRQYTNIQTTWCIFLNLLPSALHVIRREI